VWPVAIRVGDLPHLHALCLRGPPNALTVLGVAHEDRA
jgi:hypothetical protein